MGAGQRGHWGPCRPQLIRCFYVFFVPAGPDLPKSRFLFYSVICQNFLVRALPVVKIPQTCNHYLLQLKLKQKTTNDEQLFSNYEVLSSRIHTHLNGHRA